MAIRESGEKSEVRDKDVALTLLSGAQKSRNSPRHSSSSSESTSNVCVSVPLPRSEGAESTMDAGETERGTWGRQCDFFLSCVGYAVGLGNIWRFPYLCYESGGGAFLIPYVIFLIICGMPLFFLEMSFGQFGSLGPVAIWKICPLMKGIGYGMVLISTIVCVYYNVIIAWTLFYIYQSYDLAWSTCDNWWNTPNCVDQKKLEERNITLAHYNSYLLSQSLNISWNDTLNNDAVNAVSNASKTTTASEEFWLNNVLHQSSGIHELGEIQWPLALCLFIAWVFVFLCLQKGVKSSGKVVYLSATFPYLVLLIFLGRGLTLDGAKDGISFYLTPRWELLMSFKVWGDAATQIFYSVGAAWGAILTMASYNKYSHNVYRDSMVIPVINCLTSFLAGLVVFSIIGFMAHETGQDIKDVVSQGPGLAFVVYPEAISRLPLSPVWAFLFFFMLFAIGLDSQFGMFETAISAFIDEFPGVLQKRKTIFTAFLCFIMFLLGLPCVTEGGMFVLQLIDKYSATFSLMIISLLEAITIGWIYGVDRFRLDIKLMIGHKPSFWWKLCWCYITPGTIVCLLVFIIVSHEPATYNGYEYPDFSIGLGWLIALCSILPVPIMAVSELLKAKGSFKQRLLACLTPTPEWGPAIDEHRFRYKLNLSVVASNFPQMNVLSHLHNPSESQVHDGYDTSMEPNEQAPLNAENYV